MLLAPSLILVLAAAPAPVRLAAPGLTPANIDPTVLTFFSDHLSQQLALNGLSVMTSSEMGAIIGLERQRSLLSCSDSQGTSCLTELSNALGVDGMVLGSIGKFEDVYQVNVKVVSARDAQPFAIHSGRATGDKALLDELNRAARALATQTLAKLGREAPVVVAAPAEPVDRPSTQRRNTGVRNVGKWMFLGGSAAAVGGVVIAVVSDIDSDASYLGGTFILMGLASAGVGGVVYLVGGTEEVPVSAGILTTPAGLGFGLAGTFP